MSPTVVPVDKHQGTCRRLIIGLNDAELGQVAWIACTKTQRRDLLRWVLWSYGNIVVDFLFPGMQVASGRIVAWRVAF